MPAEAAAYPKLSKIYKELKRQNEIIFEAERERNTWEIERDDLKGLARFTTNPKVSMQLIGNKRLNGRKPTERTATSRIRKVYLSD